MVARHRSKNVTLHSQGDINFVINAEPRLLRADVRAGARALGVRDGVSRHGRGRTRSSERWRCGAEPRRSSVGPMELNIPAIVGIGGSLIYLVDRYGEQFDLRRRLQPGDAAADSSRPASSYVDHLTHNVHRGNMDKWTGFYETLFNFREIRYFDIEGKKTGPVFERDDQPLRQDPHPDQRIAGRQIADRGISARYKGEGIQHIALGTDDIYDIVDVLRGARRRVPGHARNLFRTHRHTRAGPRRRRRRTAQAPHPDRRRASEGQGLLLQIFGQDAIGPIFFEFIQRKGNEGFGEGNFKALFESIELDQIRRGVI